MAVSVTKCIMVTVDSRNDQNDESDNYQNHNGQNDDDSADYQNNHGASNPKSPPVSSHSTEYPASFLNIDH